MNLNILLIKLALIPILLNTLMEKRRMARLYFDLNFYPMRFAICELRYSVFGMMT